MDHPQVLLSGSIGEPTKRKISFKYNLVKGAQGSCQVSLEHPSQSAFSTTVICAIYGPQKALWGEREEPECVLLQVRVKLVGEPPSPRMAPTQAMIKELVEKHVLDLTFAPRAALHFSVSVVSVGGGGLEATCFNAAVGAILAGGFPMKSLMVASSGAMQDGKFVVGDGSAYWEDALGPYNASADHTASTHCVYAKTQSNDSCQVCSVELVAGEHQGKFKKSRVEEIESALKEEAQNVILKAMVETAQDQLIPPNLLLPPKLSTTKQ